MDFVKNSRELEMAVEDRCLTMDSTVLPKVEVAIDMLVVVAIDMVVVVAAAMRVAMCIADRSSAEHAMIDKTAVAVEHCSGMY